MQNKRQQKMKWNEKQQQQHKFINLDWDFVNALYLHVQYYHNSQLLLALFIRRHTVDVYVIMTVIHT